MTRMVYVSLGYEPGLINGIRIFHVVWWASHSRINAFKELYLKIKRHREHILNAIRLGMSNARKQIFVFDFQPLPYCKALTDNTS